MSAVGNFIAWDARRTRLRPKGRTPEYMRAAVRASSLFRSLTEDERIEASEEQMCAPERCLSARVMAAREREREQYNDECRREYEADIWAGIAYDREVERRVAEARSEAYYDARDAYQQGREDGRAEGREW